MLNMREAGSDPAGQHYPALDWNAGFHARPFSRGRPDIHITAKRFGALAHDLQPMAVWMSCSPVVCDPDPIVFYHQMDHVIDKLDGYIDLCGLRMANNIGESFLHDA